VEQSAMFDESGAPTMAAARAAANTGIQSALSHAESDVPGWSALALEFVRKYAERNEFFPWYFITAEAELDKTFPAPATGKAYGGICRRAIDTGIIVDSGKTTAHPRRHGVKATIWKSLVFKGVA